MFLEELDISDEGEKETASCSVTLSPAETCRDLPPAGGVFPFVSKEQRWTVMQQLAQQR